MAGFVLTTVSSAALVSAIAYVCRDWVTAKVKAGVEHEYNARLEAVKTENSAKLEALRAQLSQQASMLTLAHKSLGDYAQPFHQRRLDALSSFWNAFLQASSLVPAVVVARWDVLEPDEYASGLQRGILFELPEIEITNAISMTEHAEVHRPFVGEYLWGFFFSYRALLARICLLYVKGFERKIFKPWFEDESVLFLLKNCFTDEEQGQFMSRRIGKLNALRQAAHSKFSAAIMAAASAHGETELHLKEAQKMVLAMSQVEVDEYREGLPQ